AVTVRVTAADGVAFQDYVIAVTVPVLSSDKSLSSFTVDDVVVVDGGHVSKVYGTSSVSVVATASDVNASVAVTGVSGLVTGANTVTVTVTAEDGSSTPYTVVIDVAASSNTDVSLISVDGAVVVVGGSVSKAYGVSSVVVSAVPSDVDAAVSVLGASGLHAGSNAVTVRVTAADGVAFQDYVVYVAVTAASSDVGLALFTVNGVNVLDGSQVDVGSDVSSVTVVAAASSDFASFQVSGGSGLTVGDNFVSVRVTAQDGSFLDYSAKVVKARPLSTDKSLASITVNGSPVLVDGVVDVVYGTSSVVVVATASDVNASTQVFDSTGLLTGLNSVSVVVTAEDQSFRSYEFKVRVARSNNTGLLSVAVDDVAVSLSDLAVTVAPGVSSVVVSAVASDADASVVVSGGSVLSFGLNTVLVTVTAADGVAFRVYPVSVTRTAYSSDKRLASIRVDGVLTEVGSVVSVEPGVSSVSVVGVAVDADASAVVLGSSGLLTGSNTVTVTVTAADGSSQDYLFTVYVRPLSVDTSLKLFTVNGGSVVDDQLIELDGLDDFVSVAAQATDDNASAVVSGSTGLQFGLNTVSVSVTAESGLVQVHSVRVWYPDVTDVSLKTFTVDGVDVEDGSVVDLATGTADVNVVAESLFGGEVVITGDSDLIPGENELKVTVTSLDGITTVVYTVTLNVALSTDTSITEFSINGEDVTDGHVVEVDWGTSEVEVSVTPTYAEATYVVTGNTDLQTGENEIVVTVTAADGETTEDHTAVVIVLPNTDASLAVFTVDGTDVADGDSVDLVYGVESVEVVAEATDPDATVEVVGGSDLVVGENELVVTVTAADGETQLVSTVILNVLPNTDASLAVFTVDGTD
ncbi:MAG: hypothetical protein WCG32_04615, partial [Actinomycetes bacterium]